MMATKVRGGGAAARIGRIAFARPSGGAALVEIALVLFALPVVALAAPDPARALPFAGAPTAAAALLLCLTRDFRWRDLAPKDPCSEGALFCGLAALAACGAGALAGAASAAPGGALILLAAAPGMELGGRVLLHRRHVGLAARPAAVVAVSAAATAAAYAALTQSTGAAALGLWLGAVAAAAYRATGMAALALAVHLAGLAAAALVWAAAG